MVTLAEVIGNAVTVNVIEWIGRRIIAADKIKPKRQK